MAPPKIYDDISAPLTHEELLRALSYDSATGVFRWRIATGCVKIGEVAGTPRGDGNDYLVIRVKSRLYLAHVLAWFYMRAAWPTKLIDHRDRNKANNAFANQREATKSLNGGNSKAHAHNSSGLKGIYFSKQKRKWIAEITPNGRKIYLGGFTTPIEAHAAYAAAAQTHFGEFAHAS
jgi:hypothetical protein